MDIIQREGTFPHVLLSGTPTRPEAPPPPRGPSLPLAQAERDLGVAEAELRSLEEDPRFRFRMARQEERAAESRRLDVRESNGEDVSRERVKLIKESDGDAALEGRVGAARDHVREARESLAYSQDAAQRARNSLEVAAVHTEVERILREIPEDLLAVGAKLARCLEAIALARELRDPFLNSLVATFDGLRLKIETEMAKSHVRLADGGRRACEEFSIAPIIRRDAPLDPRIPATRFTRLSLFGGR